MRRPIDVHKETVQKYLGRLAYLSQKEAEELEQAYESIKLIQKDCYHRFHLVQYFTQIKYECMHCDKKFENDKDRFY
ncbi:MAG: hypothetical protein EBU90_06380 [Proteobacteria bacterium]|nr:hypothetical protein [Pseudomonadota bacterium]NBP13544.1 hypothetical protein [bacterium]